MKRLGLVRTLKGTIIFLAVMAAVCYLEIFPDAIEEMGAQNVNVAWLVKPGIDRKSTRLNSSHWS